MLLELTTTHQPATDLGFLLHKNPGRIARKELSFGEATVFYPHASAERCTAVLYVEVDPVRLVRGSGRGDEGSLDQYVNDRPYAATSFLGTAIAEVLGTALNGRSKERQQLAETPIPLEAVLPAVPCRGGVDALRELFEPLGYEVHAEPIALDEAFPSWGASEYLRVTLRGTVRLCDLLRHLYVLLPVLDRRKHYYITNEEVEKLLKKGDEWLPAHPQRERIVAGFLGRRHSLVRAALDRLREEEPPADDDAPEAPPSERAKSLNEQRLDAVQAALQEVQPSSVLDLGCGEGKLLKRLLRDPLIERLLGVDVSLRALEHAKDRLDVDRLPERLRRKLTLAQSSLVYVDKSLAGFEAAALVEVIEHLDPPRLAALERSVFGFARPRRVVVTTPNAEYNVRWETLPAGNMRHGDHRFEWDRATFRAWAERVAETYGYAVAFRPIGEDDPEVGPPTQMAVFDPPAAKHATKEVAS